MEFDPGVMENINAIWATSYGVAGKWVFIIGAVLVFVFLVTRHKMSVMGAALALIDLKPVSNRDIWLNLLHFSVILIPLVLLSISIYVVNN